MVCLPVGRLASRIRLALALRRLPMIGEVQNHIVVNAADFDDPEFGSSRAVPFVLEIKVGDRAGPPVGVGALVKRKFFADDGDFIFNVAFSCGDPGWSGRGVYTDPRSIWFNVFFGYYQIDVPRSHWSRPFGYRDAGVRPEIEPRDVVRIGKADWNYFSNYVYGVPAAAIAPYDDIDMNAVRVTYIGRTRVGESYWDELELDGVEVVSAYTAAGADHLLVAHDPLWSPVWRAVFGGPCPRPEHTTSFIPTRMRARLYMAFRATADIDPDLGGPAYQTLIFGGTVRRDWPDAAAAGRLLGRELAALRRVLAGSYPRLGFASG